MGLGGADDSAGTTWWPAAGANKREVLNGLLYLLWTGCQWQARPKDLPPKSTVHHYFKLWDWDGTSERIHHALYVAVREQAGREASPSAAIIDSQSAKTSQKRAASMDPARLRCGQEILADGGYQGLRAAAAATATGKWIIEIVKRNELHKVVVLQAVDRRANLRLDQPQSPPRARFRALCDHCGRIHSPCHDPHHAAPLDQTNPLPMNPNFLNRL
jgi:transposase